MEEPTSSRHRRRERRRDRTAPPLESAVPPVHVAETTPATDDIADTTPATDDIAEVAPVTDDVAETTAVTDHIAGTTAATDLADVAAKPGQPPKRKAKVRRTDAERSLRGIVGAGSSQVGVIGAMRARDAARPTAEDLAAAERDLVIIRRHYVPPDTLPGAH